MRQAPPDTAGGGHSLEDNDEAEDRGDNDGDEDDDEADSELHCIWLLRLPLVCKNPTMFDLDTQDARFAR